MGTTVAEISQQEYSAYLGALADQPLGQRLAHATVKAEWDHRLLGWFGTGGNLVGIGLVLLRPIPRTRLRLAFFPEGPLLDWSDPTTVTQALPAAQKWLRSHGVFMVKIAPRVVTRQWNSATIRSALKDPGGRTRWRDLPADRISDTDGLVRRLSRSGWSRYEAPGPGFGGTLQPRYGFELDLHARTPDSIKAGMNGQWRRNIARAERNGIEVEVSEASALAEFHDLLHHSGVRNGFEPRDLAFFQRMFDAMNTEDPGMIRLYLARHQTVAHAGMLLVRSGDRASYTFGGSDEVGRDFRPSNALQWRMIQDALSGGLATFDLRGASDGIAPGDPEVGLTAFKAGLGATATEYIGEWDYLTMPVLGRIFRAYWNRRPH